MRLSRADGGVLPGAYPRRSGPARHGEFVDDWVGELDSAVVRHHDVDIDTLAAQFGSKPGGSLGQPADGGNRRKLGRREQDAHLPIMLARTSLRAMPNRRTLAALSAGRAGHRHGRIGRLSRRRRQRRRSRQELACSPRPSFSCTCSTPTSCPATSRVHVAPARDQASELICYALISDRITVAAIASMQSPGVYTFLPVNKVDPADLTTDAAQPDTTLPQPPEDTTSATTVPSESLDSTDEAILDSMDLAIASTDDLSTMMMEDSPITSVDLIAYHEPTSTLQVSVTTDATDAATRDSVAFYVTDVMAYLWEETEPTRQPDATIHPRLEVTVDDVIYGSAFDVMVDVADYAITEEEWLEIVTGDAAYRAASRISRPRRRSTTSRL